MNDESPTTGGESDGARGVDELMRCIAQGEALFAAGDLSGAQAAFEQALAADPRSPIPYNNLAVLHWEQGSVERALDCLARGLAQAPNDADLVANGARMLALCGHQADAAALLQSYLNDNPHDAAVREQLAALSATAPVHAGMQDGVVPAQDAARERQGRHVDGAEASAAKPMVSLVVPMQGPAARLLDCVEALCAHAASACTVEVVAVDDGAQPELRAALDRLCAQRANLVVAEARDVAGRAALCNAGARAARGDLLVFLRGDAMPMSGWLDALVRHLHAQPEAGIAGAKILMATGANGKGVARVRHCGVVFDADKVPRNLYEYCLAAQPFTARMRDVQAVSGSCLALLRATFDGVGGFTTGLDASDADLDLCFKVRAHGARVTVCADAVLTEFDTDENAAPADLHAQDDCAAFLSRWQTRIEADELRVYRADGLRLPEGSSGAIAMLTPLSPQKTGVAHYVEEILPYLSRHLRVDLFVDDYVPSDAEVLAQHLVYCIGDLQRVDRMHAYVQKVYQIGNNRFHASMRRTAVQHPGVIVLHEYDCKGCSDERTNRGLLIGLLGGAQGVIVHNEHSRALLQPEFPNVPFTVVPHILSEKSLQRGSDRAQARAALGLPESAFVVLSLGLVQPHKRNHVTVEAFARFAQQHPDALLVLGGEALDPRYALRLRQAIAQSGIQDKVLMTGWVSDEAFFDYLIAADVTVNLRYPARGEESGSLTRMLGCGRPALVSDYAQFAELPDDCVIKIGFEREVEQIADALQGLAGDPQLRATLSANSSRFLRERNDGARVGRLYADFCRSAAADGAARATPPMAEPAQVLFSGNVWDLTSPARALLTALDAQGLAVAVAATDVALQLHSPINADVRRRLAELTGRAPAQGCVQIHCGSVDRFERDPRAGVAVLMVHDGFAADIARAPFDEFWVPSQLVQRRLVKAGVVAERVRVLPYGISGLLYGTSVFEPQEQAQPTLLCVSDFAQGDGWQEVMLAFVQEFGGRKDISLRLKCVTDELEPEQIEAQCVTALRTFRLAHPKIAVEKFANVMYERRSVDEDDLPAYYAGAAAVIAPSCRAAFGRSVLEAMAVGMPVIATANGGQADFVSERNCMLVPAPGGKPEVAALRKWMRAVVERRPETLTRGIVARGDALRQWTWAAVAERAAERIAELTAAATSEPVTAMEHVAVPGAARVFGFNVIGYVSGNLGIGVTARNVTRMLVERGFPVAVLDLDPGLGRKGHDRSFERYTVNSADALPYAVNLLVLPPSELASLLSSSPAFFRDRTRLNVGFSMWELTVLPPQWRRALESLDVLVAESEFIRHAFQFNLSKVLTLVTEHPVYLPAQVRADRERFRLPEDGVLFITSFEPFSDPARKNPFATIEAFLRGVGAATNAHLVLKLNNVRAQGAEHPVMDRLRGYAAKHPRIHLVTDTLSYADALSLYASCDVYVSLHRAEGLGLGMLEAMALGKPVIATAWSGNMSFMDHTNACPVGYRLVAVDGSIPAYARKTLGAEASWAEADVDQAAAWMRRLCADDALRAEIGARAAQAIHDYHGRACAGRFVDEIRAIWAQREYAGAGADVVDVEPEQPVLRQPQAETPAAAESPQAPEPVAQAQANRYPHWLRKHELTGIDKEILRERAAARGVQPRVHVIVRVRRGAEPLLADTLDAMGAQLHTDWTLSVVADFPPPDPAFTQGERLRWEQVGDRAAMTAAINALVDGVAADWVVTLDAGDRLAPHALSCCADHIARHETWRFVYADEDSIDAQGERTDPRFKPDFNLDLLRSMPYTGEFCLLHRDALRAVGGFVDPSGATQHVLAFAMLDAFGEPAIGHVPEMLFHRHCENARDNAPGAFARAHAGALERHLARNGLRARIVDGVIPGSFMVDYQWDRRPLVSIVIPTRDRVELLRACIGSILERTSYPDYEIVVVDNDSQEPATLEFLAQLPALDARARVLRHPGAFNFSAINNMAAREARGEFLLLLNNDTLIVQPNWLDRLVANGLRPEVGIVGARLVYPDQTVQHAGIVAGMGLHGIGEHIDIGQPLSAPGYLGRSQVAQNLSAVTAACMLVKKSVYLEAGGMDERDLKVLFNDIDFCLKVGALGHKIVWTPFSTVLHHGSVSLKQSSSTDTVARALHELETMESRWLGRLANDPAYNRHLSLFERDARVETEIDARWDPAFHDRPRVLGFGVGSFGSWQYRVVQPCAALDRHGVAQTALTPFEDHRIRMPSIAELERLAPDTLLMHNTLHDLQLKRMADYKRVNGSFIVFGQDDLMFALPAKNPFSRKVFKDIKKRIRTALGLCDRLVVTTEPLAEACRDMAAEVRVVPNCLDPEIWGALRSRRRQGEKPRVGWAGALQHGGDLEILESVVRETADEVDWVFFGMCPEAIRPYVKEAHPPVPFDQYPARLASLDLDLALAPLEHNRFNEAKSNLRILEYGVLGWPVICTNIHPYQNAPVERVPNNPRAWINAIRARVHDLDATAAEGDALKAWVLQHWMLDAHLQEWMDALSRRPVQTPERQPAPRAVTGR